MIGVRVPALRQARISSITRLAEDYAFRAAATTCAHSREGRTTRARDSRRRRLPHRGLCPMPGRRKPALHGLRHDLGERGSWGSTEVTSTHFPSSHAFKESKAKRAS
ncbi:uncharacterized protein LOC119449485 [Dermacentor silvarum]|uniref:uncharacterized protein LOC119449485 n=1 Tax=Dermacentor silvarum TaxID=543639 RepID=UPI002100A8FB|nr:uncharacterized protein LOC119449485 [Dermacentor silvarum]